MIEALIAAGGVALTGFLAYLGIRRGHRNTAEAFLIAELRENYKTILTEVHDLKTEVKELWDARRVDAVVMRKMGDFIDVLESWIWAGNPPPPPPRPDGL